MEPGQKVEPLNTWIGEAAAEALNMIESEGIVDLLFREAGKQVTVTRWDEATKRYAIESQQMTATIDRELAHGFGSLYGRTPEGMSAEGERLRMLTKEQLITHLRDRINWEGKLYLAAEMGKQDATTGLWITAVSESDA